MSCFAAAMPPPSNKKIPEVTAYADDILRLIGDKRFCRAIVESSPGTALSIFSAIGKAEQYGIPQLRTFAKNIVNEALANKDSFLFHETDGYESGLIGDIKPLSKAMFSNYNLTEGIGIFPAIRLADQWKWDADQWRAYCRVVLMAFRSYIEDGFWNHSSLLHNIEAAVADLYKINGVENNTWDFDVINRFQVVIEFIKDAIEILEQKGVPTAPESIPLRVREKYNAKTTCYDHLAALIFEVIFSASEVRSPANQCWFIQHNCVWSELFFNLNGAAAKIVKFKVRRLIYDEVNNMKEFPNFKGAKILGFCLNVMGMTVNEKKYDTKALHKTILSWTKKNYAWLHSYNSRVAEACLVDDITYDEKNMRLVKTYPIKGLRRETQHVCFVVEPPSSLHG